MEKGLAAIIVISLNLLNASGSERHCQSSDCDRYDVPPSKNRVCTMPAYQDSTGVEWSVGTQGSCPRSLSSDVKDFCPGYVGMNMSLVCGFSNVTSVIFKDGRPLSGGATVTFNYLRKEDEGLYQCWRNDSGGLLGEFNMTVRSKLDQTSTQLLACTQTLTAHANNME